MMVFFFNINIIKKIITMATATNYIKQIELVQDGGQTLIDIGTPHLIETTYAELTQLISNRKLIKGTWYCFDYTCTVNETTVNAKSAAPTTPVFKILSLAISDNQLSEECRAMKINDSDFGNENLKAWRVWYTVNNMWGSSQGTIYRMVDDYGNDCPYDFKNVKFGDKYTFNNYSGNTDKSTTGEVRNNIIKPYFVNGVLTLNKNTITVNTNILDNIFYGDVHNVTITCASCSNLIIDARAADITYSDISKSIDDLHIESKVTGNITNDYNTNNISNRGTLHLSKGTKGIVPWCA